jgi:hypothetical protein
MPLAPVHKKLLIAQALGSVACNIPLNAALAWLTFPPVDALPMWARGNCVAGDTIGTGFFLPFITCLIMTPITRRVVRRGNIPPIARLELPGFLRIWPKNFVGRGALVGLVGAVTVALPLLGVLAAAGFESMTRGQVTVYKAIYTTVLGLIVAPLFGWRALGDEPG